MISKSLIFIKLTITLFFFIIGIYLIAYNGFYLNKNLDKLILKKPQKIIKKIINTKKEIEFDNSIYTPDELSEYEIVIKKNDTFLKILNNFFEKNNIKNLIINNIKDQYDLKNLRIGQKIIFYKNKEGFTIKIIIPVDYLNNLIINIKNNKINITKEILKSSIKSNSLKFTITSSFYQDGLKAGLPITILTDAIKLLSFDIDFQRDIKKYTEFEICYETIYTEKREKLNYGNIEFISIIIQKKELEYFMYKLEDGFVDYFTKEGKNVKKSLLKTPIDGARLSSNFGMRKHPISGYNKIHKGVDFAAPKGTPVYAGGNGVIEFASKNGGYGNYIRIRHNNQYKTAYAHLSKFKKGISKGVRVNQGDIIAYVGSTGNSTGAHLHYEIIFQNKQINPMKMNLPSGKILKGNELEEFKRNSDSIYAKHLYNLYE
jgi:murein DD-endopeptidase MepM/ murein hydrolase activator NlpD